MKIFKKNWNIQKLHVVSWLLKDVFWCFKLSLLATFMVFPTGLFTIYILLVEKENRETNLILTSWVFMNIFWMLHELHNLPFWPIQIFMISGILSTLKNIIK